MSPDQPTTQPLPPLSKALENEIRARWGAIFDDPLRRMSFLDGMSIVRMACIDSIVDIDESERAMRAYGRILDVIEADRRARGLS